MSTAKISPKHPPEQTNANAVPFQAQVPTAVFKAALSAGANAAWTPPPSLSIIASAKNTNAKALVNERCNPERGLRPLLSLVLALGWKKD